MRAALPLDRRRHKYGAQPTTVDGIRFDSKAEASRYLELRLLEKAGEIRNLEIHPPFDLWAFTVDPSQGVRLGEYVADFRYVTRHGEIVVEDVKGVRTALYRWKKRHVEAQYRITVREVYARTSRVRR